MGLIQIQQPTIEPVTLADVKTALRIDADMTDEDAFVSLLIGAARRYAESYTGRSFITQRWRSVLDEFPGNTFGPNIGMTGGICLERGPVISVDAINYTAMDGMQQQMDMSTIAVDFSSPLPRITPCFGRIWPIPLPQIGAVQVEYTAGYGPAPEDVPEGIRQWIIMRVATLYENREEVAILNRGSVGILPFVDDLLNPYQVVVQ